MLIRTILHKGLRLYALKGDRSGLPPASVEKLAVMLSFLQDMRSEEELVSVPSWKAHRLSGNLKGHWSLVVTRNWRLTFRIDGQAGEIIDIDLQDYH